MRRPVPLSDAISVRRKAPLGNLPIAPQGLPNAPPIIEPVRSNELRMASLLHRTGFFPIAVCWPSLPALIWRFKREKRFDCAIDDESGKTLKVIERLNRCPLGVYSGRAPQGRSDQLASRHSLKAFRCLPLSNSSHRCKRSLLARSRHCLAGLPVVDGLPARSDELSKISGR